MDVLEKAKENFLKNESSLNKYACKSIEAIRLKNCEEDYRNPFFRDIDKIIYSLSYTRYINKTQVYSFKENDNICKRIVHVQLVSKIARTIGRALNLNTDLIEAIALGHDIGHTPLGHTGEAFLNEISKKEINEYFFHNVQSMRNYLYIENKGKGLNLTIQTLDGILCHNGEILQQEYRPVHKTKEDVLNQYEACYKNKQSNNISPMTLEGCVVRISDIIAYIGRDLDDAIRLKLLNRSIIPKEITNVLGNTNKEIVNTIITDIIKNSMDKPYIKLSYKVYKEVNELLKFNYQNIYYNSMQEDDKKYYREGMNKLYEVYKEALLNKDLENEIYTIFLNEQNDAYLNNTKLERKVIDFIAGMTDDFFINKVKKYYK